ncbi:hypothetical protein [Stenotrophomonas maltophilia]|uniref:hypothetical protein n=1 Tax=Stenotrophomonas maltophilia TaxID=40324 RepID=UPI0025525D04|nr:hypothetical protein [Stenotrophomonas maltophilia]
MSDWKKTNYGTPKTWAEIQHEKSEAELEKVSASPFWPIVGVFALGLLSVGCLVYVVIAVVR